MGRGRGLRAYRLGERGRADAQLRSSAVTGHTRPTLAIEGFGLGGLSHWAADGDTTTATATADGANLRLPTGYP
eukprot:88974-Pyramimonas_sp.AAC.1